MKKVLALGAVTFMCAILLIIGAPEKAPAKSIKLNLISYTPSNTWNYKTFDKLWVKKLNELAKDKIVVNFKGGPEIMGIFDMAKAVGAGSVDLALTAGGFYGNFVPGADVWRVPDMGPTEWRKDGTYEHLQKLHNPKGLQFIGWLPLAKGGKYLYIASRVPLRNRNDLKNRKIACSPAGVNFFKKLGAVPVVTPVPEFYSAVERGVADGNWMGIDTFISSSHYEVAPYVIGHPFSNSTLCVVMNLKKWNSLSRDEQNLVMKVQLETEKAWPAEYDSVLSEIKAQAPKVGAEFVKWSQEDAKWLSDMYAEAMYGDYEKKYGKNVVDEYKKIWGIK